MLNHFLIFFVAAVGVVWYRTYSEGQGMDCRGVGLGYILGTIGGWAILYYI